MSNIEFKRVAVADLGRHLDRRFEMLLHDFMDRCAVLEIEYDKATVMALQIINHYAVIAAIGMHATEDEYLALCRWHYQQGIKSSC